MQLTPDELKVLDVLRKQHRGWKASRGLAIYFAIVTLAIGVVIFLRGDDWSYFVGPLWLLLAIGSLNYASSWSGRPTITLLLKLVDDAIERGQAENQRAA